MTVDEMMVLARLACAEEFLRGQHVGTTGYREYRYGTETALAQLEVGARGAVAAEREACAAIRQRSNVADKRRPL